MEFLNDIDIYPKIIVALTGLVAAFIKIKDSYSTTSQKQEIKLDLEIYELLNKSGDFESVRLKKTIEDKMNNSMDRNNDGLTNFFVGLVVFVGFGLWSIDIFQSHNSFNGLIILTTFVSFIGLSVMFGGDRNLKSKQVFYKIEFYDKSNFVWGFIITMVTAVLTPVLIIKMEGFSFWQFVSGLFFIVGLFSLLKNIKRIK